MGYVFGQHDEDILISSEEWKALPEDDVFID